MGLGVTVARAERVPWSPANVFRIEGELARCRHFASVDLTGFFDTCHEIVEQVFLHWRSNYQPALLSTGSKCSGNRSGLSIDSTERSTSRSGQFR